MMRKFVLMMIAAAAGVVSLTAQADVAGAKILVDKYAHVAKNIDPASKGASAEGGKTFFERELMLRGKPIACASCHTANPAATGKHIVTKKEIMPLAPSANAARFGDLDKVEKNFEKHCQEVISRTCTAQEKADVVAYLLTVK